MLRRFMPCLTLLLLYTTMVSTGGAAEPLWTWIQGSRLHIFSPNHGAQGVASAGARPGSRYGAASWTDSAGRFWLYGGQGSENPFGAVFLNDLWRFEPASGLWTWLKGSNLPGQSGIYGARGLAAPGNTPGARTDAVTWIDRNGRLWLFGGYYVTAPFTDELAFNDLWRFDPATGNWTWIKGGNQTNQAGIYGTQGQAGAANTPGARRSAAAWIDPAGRLWLFGGKGYDGFGDAGYLNDLWRFDPATGNWTWIKGSNQINRIGIYGTRGTAAAANTPGARNEAAAWTDDAGRFWLFGGTGGDGFDVFDVEGNLNDLWRLDPASGNWTWMTGSKRRESSGAYGTIGVPSPANTPGARTRAIAWTGADGRLWLLGGEGLDIVNDKGLLNELWVFDPADPSWGWMAGNNLINRPGIYGTRGVERAVNTPGGREGGGAWTAQDGRLWLLGGWAYDVLGRDGLLGDLWRFDPRTEGWTWTGGSSTLHQAGSYGTQGQPDPANTPGGRHEVGTWVGRDGQFWFFGGNGPDAGAIQGYQNDLWRYHPATGVWTWIKGNKESNSPGVYGSRGQAASANTPGGRYGPVTWSDASGRLWLFGGFGLDTAADHYGMLNDLWRFEPATGNWTWIKGRNTIQPPGIYGTRGTAAAANTPGGRFGARGWTDADGRFWLFGGVGVDALGNEGWLNDLWRFDPATGNWTWVKGSSARNQNGTYGTQGQSAAVNHPGGRYLASTWIDRAGRLWLFGGIGYDATTFIQGELLNDLWRFDPATGNWTWIKGSNLINQRGVYGTLGRAAPTNTPGAREGGAAWVAADGRLWLLGGEGLDSLGGMRGLLNDLWAFDWDTGNWVWLKGSNISHMAGIYGTQGHTVPVNTPGGRKEGAAWKDGNDRLWLFGGRGLDDAGMEGTLNDLWILTIQNAGAGGEWAAYE